MKWRVKDMVKQYRGKIQAGVSGVSMFIAMQMSNLMLTAGWSGFADQLKRFFEDGMAGLGLPQIGMALMAIGLFGAAILFVVHKVAQQSSLPRPGGFLMVALVGAAIGQWEKIQKLIELIRDTLFGWLGL